jgi:hypothetical protein
MLAAGIPPTATEGCAVALRDLGSPVVLKVAFVDIKYAEALAALKQRVKIGYLVL